MKKKRKFLLSFILLTLGIFCFATTAHAKSQLVQLKAGKTYTLDVNGDGKKDKLKFIQKTIQRDYPQQTHRIIYINGKKIKDITSYGSFPLYFYKTNNANEYLIVGTHWKGGSNSYDVYHCKKTFKNIGTLPTNYMANSLRLSGNNVTLTTYSKTSYITKYCPVIKINNGRISLASPSAKVVGPKNFKATQYFRLYQSVNSTYANGISVYSGQKIYISSVYLKKYAHSNYYDTFFRVRVNGKYVWMTQQQWRYIKSL